MNTQRQSIHSIHNKKFWTEFFYLYESLPALWDMNNPLYKNRQVKCDAYNIMVDKLREIEPNADRDDVLRKINIFRTNYRRECSRINISLQEGRHYQSTLWYYDLLSFLQTADTRKDKKRKLDDDGEKSIMRKRRASNVISKSSGRFIAARKKEHLIEYQPNSTDDFEYDLDEEHDFDYVPDELADTLVDDIKSDTASEIQQSNLQLSNSNNYQGVEEENDEDNQSQHEFHQHEFESYTLQKNNNNNNNNNQKVKFAADNMTQLASEIVATETALEINDESQENEVLHEWCIKPSNTQNQTIQQKKQNIFKSSATATRVNKNTCESLKFVRDVKTMTSTDSNSCGCCCSRLSESSEILAKSWAIQYNELTKDQKLLARKAINDILFEGCMGHLTIDSNGRVIIKNTDYKDLKPAKDSRSDEVESGKVYEQAPASSSSLTSGVGCTTSVTPSVTSTHKVRTDDDWLKL